MVNQYETYLNPVAELLFQLQMGKQKQQGNIHPFDIGRDYDFRGLYYSGLMGNQYSSESHFPDLFKKPNHETFSNQSIYYNGQPNAVKKWDMNSIYKYGRPIR